MQKDSARMKTRLFSGKVAVAGAESALIANRGQGNRHIPPRNNPLPVHFHGQETRT
jgi:hypothetical protein